MSIENLGRDMLLNKGGTVLAGLQTTGLSWTGEAVDRTQNSSAGYRVYSDKLGVQSFSLSGEGVTDDDTIRNIVFGVSSKKLTDITLEWPKENSASVSGATLAGDVVITAFEETGTDGENMTFSFTMESSGAWTYTAEL